MIDDTYLPFSEETLGAYLEGNLSDDETENVEQLIGSNSDAQSLVDDVHGLDVDWSQSIHDDIPDFSVEFEVPTLQDDWMEVVNNEPFPVIALDGGCIGEIPETLESMMVIDEDTTIDVDNIANSDHTSEDGPIEFNKNIDDDDNNYSFNK